MNAAIDEPGTLTLGVDGSMVGRTAGYCKYLKDMVAVYRDQQAYRRVNSGSVPFVTLFCYSAHAGQNDDLLSRASGVATLIVESAGGWPAVRNPDHAGYQSRLLFSDR